MKTKAEILAKRISPTKFYLPTLVREQIYLMFDDYADQEVLKATKELKKENESIKQHIRLEQNHCKELQAKLDKANIESYNQAIDDVKERLSDWQNTGHFIIEILTLKK